MDKVLMHNVSFFDFEVNPDTQQIGDIGAIYANEKKYRGKSVADFTTFMRDAEFIVGHNVFRHDLKYLHHYLGENSFGLYNTIDTLFLSPLMFPARPYHRLLKDDKLQVDELNNPLNDAIKARHLFNDIVVAFTSLSPGMKQILFNLLHTAKEFRCFFGFLNYTEPIPTGDIELLIRTNFEGRICSAVELQAIINHSPVALAYALALINVNDQYSITPPWVLRNYKDVDVVLKRLRGKACPEGCKYCNRALNPYDALKRHFGFSKFRSYDAVPLQEDAVNAAIQGDSLLAVFPTGGGKSITFQLPALMDGENTKSLTVIISPLQSLMKDQVDNLERIGIVNVVTINGLLDPIERSKAIERVQDGSAHLLYISPESLRSVTIEKLLLGRKISRFVIDEAHCFSSWGQDFRVDYLYIGEFIANLQSKKGLEEKIPVSCFTATAKQRVIEDIRAYFKDKLSLDLKLFRSDASRTNLHYKVYYEEGEEEKYAAARRLLELKKCPTIIYVSRTNRAAKLAKRLTEDGFIARAFHGKMDKEDKTKNQNDFIAGNVDVMVATSAFGMGVDKSDVGMVLHYDISDSLENYVQEAGRAGRDEAITADCYVLFNEEDLNKHFILLNQTRLDIKEINQVWRAIKDLTKTRDKVTNSALEIARKAGWDDNIKEIETRVFTAISALEEAGYLKRGQNMPRIFANSILSKTAQEAIDRINASANIPVDKKEKAVRIIKKLFSSKSRSKTTDEQAESRIDYIAEQLGIVRQEVINIVQLLREEKILADTKDLTAFIKKGENIRNPLSILEKYKKLEDFFLSVFTEEEKHINLKELSEHALQFGCEHITPQVIKTLLNFWAIRNWIKQSNQDFSRNHINIVLSSDQKELKEKMAVRHQLVKIIVEYLFKKAGRIRSDDDEVLIEFSVQDLKDEITRIAGMYELKATTEDVEDSLFFLSRIDAIKIEGGFLVVYNRLTIDRIEKNNKIQYKQEDYQKLKEFYQNKVQQIHIVGEYARKMVENYKDALQFIDDYFRLNYFSFLNKYFPGSRQDDIKRTMTPAKFRQLFGALSPAQLEIIKDSANQYILVAAGPGSGKTRVLVHKLASLLLAEDIKHEQLLMLTFSRAAATEFKKRLLNLIGNAAHFVEIKTFHSYCFDLLGKVGNLTDADSVLKKAIESIRKGEIELSRITKAVLVVDEAQDMNEDEFELVNTLIRQNEDMRVIMVGDDDQNIYEFRGSDSKFMQKMVNIHHARLYELVDNYRSKSNLVQFSNQWVCQLINRIKETPVMPVDGTDGLITVIEHANANLIVPLVQSILNADLAGSTCVLTRTNDEAVQVAGLLTSKGFQARLIQSNDGFNLYNLKELRWFCDIIQGADEFPIVSEEQWMEAKKAFGIEFQNSNKLNWCLAIINEFEIITPGRKYKSDWKTFVSESKFEDFVQINNETIYVSTIHKAKGKEFDNVFLLLANTGATKQEIKREIYVAMTRAKHRLAIHYNGNYFSPISCNNLFYTIDQNEYTAPGNLTFLLTHKDVNLGYFGYVQNKVNRLVSGNNLLFTQDGLTDIDGNKLLKFSKAFSETLTRLSQTYIPSNARVNFVVYWKAETNDQEIKIILPELTLQQIKI